MVFDFLLRMHPTLLVVIVSIFVSTLMVLVYKYMTDQDLMKRLKEEIKELQTEMKTLQSNPAKMAEMNKKAMETNMKYMMHSLKPTLVTFLPIILIFGWLNSNIAYDPLVVGEEFSIELEFYDGISGAVAAAIPEGLALVNNETYTIKDNKVRFVLTPEVAGTYTLQYALLNDASEQQKTWEHDVKIAPSLTQKGYEKPLIPVKDQVLKTITVNLKKFNPLGENFNIFGWYPGWIALYIVLSLVCSLGLRKWLKVY